MTDHYVYIRSEDLFWTVGFYDPSGQWQAESDHDDRENAARRVHYLNGGNTTAPIPDPRIKRLEGALRYLAYERNPIGEKYIDTCSETCQQMVIEALSDSSDRTQAE